MDSIAIFCAIIISISAQVTAERITTQNNKIILEKFRIEEERFSAQGVRAEIIDDTIFAENISIFIENINLYAEKSTISKNFLYSENSTTIFQSGNIMYITFSERLTTDYSELLLENSSVSLCCSASSVLIPFKAKKIKISRTISAEGVSVYNIPIPLSLFVPKVDIFARASGFTLPKIYLSKKQGLLLQSGYFFSISPFSDITPSFLYLSKTDISDKFAVGSDVVSRNRFERKAFSDSEIISLYQDRKIYLALFSKTVFPDLSLFSLPSYFSFYSDLSSDLLSRNIYPKIEMSHQPYRTARVSFYVKNLLTEINIFDEFPRKLAFLQSSGFYNFDFGNVSLTPSVNVNSFVSEISKDIQTELSQEIKFNLFKIRSKTKGNLSLRMGDFSNDVTITTPFIYLTENFSESYFTFFTRGKEKYKLQPSLLQKLSYNSNLFFAEAEYLYLGKSIYDLGFGYFSEMAKSKIGLIMSDSNIPYFNISFLKVPFNSILFLYKGKPSFTTYLSYDTKFFDIYSGFAIFQDLKIFTKTELNERFIGFSGGAKIKIKLFELKLQNITDFTEKFSPVQNYVEGSYYFEKICTRFNVGFVDRKGTEDDRFLFSMSFLQ